MSRRVGLFFAVLFLGLVSCKNNSPKLEGLVPQGERKTSGSEVQTLSSKVDILFVIDDSGSMDAHQTNLVNNIDGFLQGLQQNRFIDYHIGVISTSEEEASGCGGFGGYKCGPGAGRLSGTVRYVDKNTPNGVKILRDNMLLGTWGSSTERMFSPVKLALTDPNLSGWNAGFYRPDAVLAIVMITDAEDQSEIDWGYPPRDPSLRISPQQFYNFLLDLKKRNERKLATYGVIIPLGVPNSVCNWDDPGSPAVRLDEFFKISKGITYSLCDVDYGTKLAGIGSDLVSKIGRSIELDRRPEINTIEVTYGTQVIQSNAQFGWTYNSETNMVTFGKDIVWEDQPSGTQVEVKFKPAID